MSCASKQRISVGCMSSCELRNAVSLCSSHEVCDCGQLLTSTC